jgi:hypothetical protein
MVANIDDFTILVRCGAVQSAIETAPCCSPTLLTAVFGFIDPHGDTADQITNLIPKNRMRDFIWIDPDASLVPPFNPLHFNSPEEFELGNETLFTTFKSLAGSAWGDEA